MMHRSRVFGGALITALVLPLLAVPPAEAAKTKPRAVQKMHIAKVHPVQAKRTASSAKARSAPLVKLPAPATKSARVAVSASWSKPAQGLSLRAPHAGAGSKYAIQRVASNGSGRAAGPVFEIAADNPTAARASSAIAAVEVKVGYSDYATAIGGDWASRLRLVQLEDCTKTSCSTVTPLKTSNHAKSKTLTATTKPSAQSSKVRIAASATSSGTKGDYTATSLKDSATWTAGLQSGDFNWSYPITAVPVETGPKPDLNLTYSSSAVDGLTSTTNNQASWVGDGFSLEPGFIERSYEACADVSGTPDNVGDLCWRGDNLAISLNGASSVLVQDGSSNSFRKKNDDGTRIERLTSAGINADDNGEYWKVTTLDGTKYYFGRNKRWTGDSRTTDSVSTVPVYGSESGEPCHGSTYAASVCDQAWRWSLDYVVDPNGNSMSLFWDQEKNKYQRVKLSGEAKAEDPRVYDRSPVLKSIEYGARAGSDSPAAGARIVFTTSGRCISGSDCGDKPTSSNASKWPDVPFDQICELSATSCEDRTAPSFFSSRRLTKITTQVRGVSGDFADVNEWTLNQDFPETGDASTDPDNPNWLSRAMWLNSIQQTGKVGGVDTPMPAITFGHSQSPMDNRVETSAAYPAFARYRVNSIRNGAGGTTAISYSAPDCTASSKPASTALDSNDRRCFPVWYQPWWNTSRKLEFFHKYRVNSVTQTDNTGGSPNLTTTYGYGGGDGWHYTTATIDKAANRTWNEWRGYSRVSVSVGGSSPKTYKHTLYLRGMNGDKKQAGGTKAVTVVDPDGDSPDVVDLDQYAGFERRVRRNLGNGGAKVDVVINTPWSSAVTASSNGRDARITKSSGEMTVTRLSDGTDRTARVTRSFNGDGLPTTEHDQGDTSVDSDNTCTTTSYAVNSADGLRSYPSVQTQTALACGTAATGEQDIVSSKRTSYDGQGAGNAPTKGNVTKIESAEKWDAGIKYQVDETRTYDATYGRVLSVKDADNKTTTTDYDTSGALVDKKTTTNPLNQTSSVELNRSWGTPKRETDVAGLSTDYSYDSLGRVKGVWGPDRNKDTDTPSAKFSYFLSASQASYVTTEKLNAAGNYLKTVSFYDGLLRERSTQSPSASSSTGRLITEKTYDDRGWVDSERGPYSAAGAVSTTLTTAEENQIDSYTLKEYDRVGRVTKESLASLGGVKWSTATAYLGDRVKVTPPAGGIATTALMDVRGRTTRFVQHTGATPEGSGDNTYYTYTSRGELRTMTDSSGSIWSRKYDIRGRVIEQSDPDKGTTINTYDTLDRLLTTTDARGAKLWTGYDALGRKTELKDDSSSGAARANWQYNALGQLESSTRVDDGKSYSTTYAYDEAGRVKSSTLAVPDSETGLYLSDGYTSTMTYNPDGSIKKIGQPQIAGIANEDLTYRYDALGNVKGLDGTVPIVNDTLFTATGQVSMRTLGSITGVKAYDIRDYDPATLRLKRQTYSLQNAASTNRLDLRYAIDPAGNVTAVNDVANNDIASSASRRQCFSYDYKRRLTGAWTSSGTTCAAPTSANLGTQAPYSDSYEYSTSGNRTKRTSMRPSGSGIATTTYSSIYPVATAAHPHAPDSTTSAPGQKENFTYDETGNTTKRAVSGTTKEKSYVWDAEGRVSKVTDGSGKSVSYVYDADGNRLIETEKDAGGGTTKTLHVGNAEITVKGDDRSVVRTYCVGDTPVAVRNKNGLQLIGADHQNTPVITSSDQSGVWSKRQYTPFGEDLSDQSAGWPSNRSFLNKKADDLSATVHLEAREYDPAAGRFLSVDPILDKDNPQQFNGYAYSSNTPVSRSDPSGQLDIFGFGLLGVMLTTYAVANAVRPPVYGSGSGYGDPSAVCRVPATPTKPPSKGPSLSGFFHGVLDGVGLVPVVGELADGLNAAWYEAEGDHVMAALSTASMVPLFGWGATAAKVGVKGVSKGSKAVDVGRETTILGENMGQRVIPFAEGTGARHLGFGATADEWAAMTPAQRWKLNDGMLRARINQGDAFSYIGRDPSRPASVRAAFDLTGSELLRLNSRGVPYTVVSPADVFKVIGRY